jgi:hypothetical protein
VQQLKLMQRHCHIELLVALLFDLWSSHATFGAERSVLGCRGQLPPLTERFALGKPHLATLSENLIAPNKYCLRKHP